MSFRKMFITTVILNVFKKDMLVFFLNLSLTSLCNQPILYGLDTYIFTHIIKLYDNYILIDPTLFFRFKSGFPLEQNVSDQNSRKVLLTFFPYTDREQFFHTQWKITKK